MTGIACSFAETCRRTSPISKSNSPARARLTCSKTTARASLAAIPGRSRPTIVNDLRYGYVRQGFCRSRRRQRRLRRLPLPATPTAPDPHHHHQRPRQQHRGQPQLDQGQITPSSWEGTGASSIRTIPPIRTRTTTPAPILTGWAAILPILRTIGLPTVNDGFGNPYEIAYANLVGTVPISDQPVQLQDHQPRRRQSARRRHVRRTATSKPMSSSGIVQDAWRVKPNLTITFRRAPHHPANAL